MVLEDASKGRFCPECGCPVTGRPNKKFHSASCRVKASHRRNFRRIVRQDTPPAEGPHKAGHRYFIVERLPGPERALIKGWLKEHCFRDYAGLQRILRQRGHEIGIGPLRRYGGALKSALESGLLKSLMALMVETKDEGR